MRLLIPCTLFPQKELLQRSMPKSLPPDGGRWPARGRTDEGFGAGKQNSGQSLEGNRSLWKMTLWAGHFAEISSYHQSLSPPGGGRWLAAGQTDEGEGSKNPAQLSKNTEKTEKKIVFNG